MPAVFLLILTSHERFTTRLPQDGLSAESAQRCTSSGAEPPPACAKGQAWPFIASAQDFKAEPLTDRVSSALAAS